MVGIIGFAYYAHAVDQSPLALFKQSVQWLIKHPAGPAVFILGYCSRPITMLPASLFCVAAGYCFGSVWGCIWAHLAATVAAILFYAIGYFVGLRRGLARWLDYCINLITAHGSLSIIILRWCFLPYDPVSYLGGALRLPLGGFILANFIGNLPGTTSVVLMGASLQHFDGQDVPINWRLLAISWVILGTMLGVGRWLSRRIVPGISSRSSSSPSKASTHQD